MDTLILTNAMLFLSTLSLRRATRFQEQQAEFFSHFYPRSPCGERQALGLLGWLRVLISIHALLAESDGNCPSGYQRPYISIHALLAESDQSIRNFDETT